MSKPSVAAPIQNARRLAELKRQAQAQLALVELFPHLRHDADAAMRDLFIALRAGQTRQQPAA